MDFPGENAEATDSDRRFEAEHERLYGTQLGARLANPDSLARRARGKGPISMGTHGLEPLRLDSHVPVEVAETEWPIVVERYGLIPRAFTATRSTTPSQPGLRLAQGMYV